MHFTEFEFYSSLEAVISKNPIAPEVRQFILINIDSIAQLEALLLLRASPAEKWDVAAVANRLYISEKETSTSLASLCERRLTVISGDDPIQHTYRPASGDPARMADRLADVYAGRLAPVTHLIHSNRGAKQAGEVL